MYLSFSLQQDVASETERLIEDVARHKPVLRAIHRGSGEVAAEAMLDVVLDGKNALIKALSDVRVAPRS